MDISYDLNVTWLETHLTTLMVVAVLILTLFVVGSHAMPALAHWHHLVDTLPR